MTARSTRWWAAGLLCLALWPAEVPARDGLWHGYMADGTLAYLKGDYAEAERLFAAAREVAEGLGPQDLRLAMSLNGLADACRAQGDYARAERLYERALAIAEAALGPEHPYVAASLGNYAALLRETGRGAEAAELEARAAAIRAKQAGGTPAK